MPGHWIRFRNYFRREDVGENTVLRLVLFLVFGLQQRQILSLALVASVSTYPVALEAVLRAEVALLVQLLAVRTLQRASVVLAVCAGTLARGVSGHCVQGFCSRRVSVEVY